MVGGTRVKWLSMGIEKWKQGVANFEKEDVENKINSLYEELDDKNDELTIAKETLEMYEARYAAELQSKRGKAKHVMVRLMHGKMLPAFALWKETVEKAIKDEVSESIRVVTK